MAVAAIKAGADDFIEKPIDDVQLVAAINRCLPRAMQREERGSDSIEARFARLTPRQAEIFDLVAEGLTSQAIAARLKISPRTVESYRAEVMDKMRADSIAVLVRQAIRLGRITP
jgi:two-component system response regulator FixJ